MYVPHHHEQTDLATLHTLIVAHPLGAWVTPGVDGLTANHVPFELDPARGPYGTLVCHVARANPVWHTFSKSVESIVLFQGADHYVSPSWYPSKQAHGKVVPTWNYMVVHAYGMPRIVEDRDALLRHLTQLTDTHEHHRPTPWKVTDAPPEFVDQLLNAIVGIEIPIARLVGKWKLSQNRPEADRQGVAAGLRSLGTPESETMAGWILGKTPPPTQP